MSSTFQQKMYNYEVAPPTGAWEKIAAELDESVLAREFATHLRNIQIAPPPYLWQQITAALDETGSMQDYAEKLSAMEVFPPGAIWNNIQAKLDAEQEETVPVRRLSPWLKYAAAAVVTGFLAWGSISLLNNRSTDTGITKKELQASSIENSPASSVEPVAIPGKNLEVPDITAALDEARNDAALEASKKTFAKLDVQRGSKIKNAAGFYFSAPPEDEYQGGITRGIDIDEIMPGANLANRYIVLMTPDGNIIRMSKKFGDLVCCVSGEEQDKNCVDQMKKWREKIADPSATHSSGNFMDILGLINTLQDN